MNLLILFLYLSYYFYRFASVHPYIICVGRCLLFICQRFIDKRLFSVWWGLVPVALCSVGSGILNLTFDFTFVFYAFSQIAIFLQAMPWFTCLAEKEKL